MSHWINQDLKSGSPIKRPTPVKEQTFEPYSIPQGEAVSVAKLFQLIGDPQMSWAEFFNFPQNK